MEKFYSEDGIKMTAQTTIRFGQEKNISDIWKRIIDIESPTEKKKAINALVSTLEKNSQENGFFTKNDVVSTQDNGNGFKLDDMDLYYLFFDELKKQKEKAPNDRESVFLLKGIINTISSYFGGLDGDRTKRNRLTTIEYTDEDDIVPSISAQKGENCSLCTERASIAHNLFLLAGRPSFFVTSKSCNFRNNASSEFYNDGHSFCIVSENNGLGLCDVAMGIYKTIPRESIKEMLEGKPLEITDSKRNQTLIYANSSNKISR